MSKYVIALFLICASVEQTQQDCTSVNIVQRYYSRFSRLPTSKKYVQCRNEAITPNFHEKLTPFTSGTYIQWLEINDTDSPEIPAGAFGSLHALPELRINGAGVRVIQPGAFDGLSELTQLSLKNNKISEVNENYFNNLTKLVELDLSFNNVATVAEKSFASLENLQRLIFQNNLLGQLPPKVFDRMTKLEVLDVSFNKLVTMENSLFSKLTNLKTLYLNNNNLNVFDGKLLSDNTQLENLYINNNYVLVINNLKVSSSLTVFNASHNTIKSMSFSYYTSIRTVDLSFNGITGVKNFIFKNVSITELYLDENYLGLNPIESETFNNLTSLEVLSLTNNQIRHLNPTLFKNNNKMRKLNVARNYLRNTDLPKLPISVQELNLSSNNFDSWLNITDLNNLRSFDTSFNNFTQISFNFLKGMKWLFRLNLSNNRITKIDLGSFRDLKILRELDLSFNNVSVLELGVFVGLDNLYRLDLSHNKLNTLKDGTFHNLRYLQILDLSFNNVTFNSVENTLEHISTLREIGLASNGWTCSLLTQIIKDNKKIKLVKAGDYDVTNVDGIACKHGDTNPENLVNLEAKSFKAFSSGLTTNNVLLILIFIVLVLKLVLKYVSKYFIRDRFKTRYWMNKSEQELQLVNH